MTFFRRFALGCAFVGAAFSVPLTANAAQTCSMPNAQGTAVVYSCAVTYTPSTANWLTKFKTWVAANQTTGYMACFGPGTYTLPSTSSTLTNTEVDDNRLVVRNAQNLKLCAPTGGATFEHRTVNPTNTPLTTVVRWPTLHIATSTGVSIKGLEFKNTSDYLAGTSVPNVTRAVWVDRSPGTRFFDSKMSALGKEVVIAEGATVSLSGATVSCAYYCLGTYWRDGQIKSSFTVANSQFTIHHTKDPADQHAAIYMDRADYNISDSSFNFVTGQGFVAGVATTVDWVNVTNITITGTTAQGRPRMFGWVPMHPNLTNMQVNYTGSVPYTQYGRAYYCIRFDHPACESGFESVGNQGAIFNYRPNPSSNYVTAALPPAKTKKILFLNSSGQDALWAQGVIVQNASGLNWPAIQQWASITPAALGGWLDAGDTVLTGDFLVPGQQRVLFFNSEPLGGAISVRAVGANGNESTLTTEVVVDWTPALVSNLGGWHDANDKLVAGDFTGLGRAQLLFMNVAGTGGAFHMAAVDGANNQLQSLAVVPWSTALSTNLAGWMDAGDKLVAGDFTGSGRAQLLFLNADGGTQGAASLRQYNALANAFDVVSTVPWDKVVGTNAALWKQATARTLTGDFLGLNKDQLMFINPTGTGVAISVWAFDPASGTFTEIHKMNYGANEIPSLSGFVDSNDWQLGF
jgi:hypothetical protein